MSLLSRIATCNGDKARKAAAHRTLTVINKPKISAWNRRLQGEISRKRAAQYPVEEIVSLNLKGPGPRPVRPK